MGTPRKQLPSTSTTTLPSTCTSTHLTTAPLHYTFSWPSSFRLRGQTRALFRKRLRRDPRVLPLRVQPRALFRKRLRWNLRGLPPFCGLQGPRPSRSGCDLDYILSTDRALLTLAVGFRLRAPGCDRAARSALASGAFEATSTSWSAPLVGIPRLGARRFLSTSRAR